MLSVFKRWYAKYFSNPDAVILFIFIASVIGLIYFFGSILAPVLASIVLAYLLSGFITKLETLKIPHTIAVLMVYLSFIGVGIFCVLWLLPQLWRQAASFFQELPTMVSSLQQLIADLTKNYPISVSPTQLQSLTTDFKNLLGVVGQTILSFSLASIPSIISLLVYLFLVPFLVYFFLMDKDAILAWSSRYLPRNKSLIKEIWQEINAQFGKYIQGRVVEIFIVSIVSYVVYMYFGLQYAMLLAVLSGVTLLLPYIGAIIATVPILLMAILQWGWSSHFAYFAITYGVITFLAGNVLEPLLFAEIVNIHPVAVIVAMLIFGGLFGFWGVVFAIPLATVIRAILNAWPVSESQQV